MERLPIHFNRFDVVASVAVISLKLWIGANARDGLNQLHLLAAAQARDRMPGVALKVKLLATKPTPSRKALAPK